MRCWKKFLRPSHSTGETIDDPFSRHDAAIHWRLGVRATGGLVDHAGAGLGFGIAALAARPLDGRVMLATRLDWSHRELDTIGANAGFSYIALHTRSLVVSTGLAMRGEVRLQDSLDMMEVSRVGMAAAADVDLAVLRLPLAFGLRFEQGFTELVEGARARAVLVEVGYDWR